MITGIGYAMAASRSCQHHIYSRSDAPDEPTRRSLLAGLNPPLMAYPGIEAMIKSLDHPYPVEDHSPPVPVMMQQNTRSVVNNAERMNWKAGS